MIPKAMFEDERLKGLDILVYGALDSFADGEGIAWPSIQAIATRAHTGDSTVVRALRRLENAGYIQKAQRREPGKKEFASSLYKILFRCGEVVSEGHNLMSQRHNRLCQGDIRVMSQRPDNDTQERYTENEKDKGAVEARATHEGKVEALWKDFWRAYPRKSRRDEARKAFFALFPYGQDRERLNRIRDAIEDRLGEYVAEFDACKERGEKHFTKNAANWLHDEAFEDE